jgi:hypothetical protein
MAKILPVQMAQILLGRQDIRSTMVYYHGDIETIKDTFNVTYYSHTKQEAGSNEKP